MAKRTKISGPQINYLYNARAVCDAGTGRGNHFEFEGPGSFVTAVVCMRKGWIEDTNDGYQITPAGRAVLKET